MAIKKLSEEHKKNLSKNHVDVKGKNNPFYGKKHTEESKMKMSKWHDNKVLSNEHKKKIGLGNEGKTVSLLSRTKISLAHTGEKEFNGFRHEQPNKERTSNDYKVWRKTVFERDNYICQVTSVKGGDLAVHHIKNYRDNPKIRLEMKNGVTMTNTIHILFHRLYGHFNNNKQQLVKFKKYYKKDRDRVYKAENWNELIDIINNNNPFIYTIIMDGFVNEIIDGVLHVKYIYFRKIPVEMLKKDVPIECE